MDDLNNTFNWRWMLDSVQPQGPTGGSVGALFKDMRDSMKGGPGGNVDKAFAMNKALRDENVAYGNSLGDLEKENDKHNLAWANFKNSLNSQSNQRMGHMNKLTENLIAALNSGDKGAIDIVKQQIMEQYPDKAQAIFDSAESSSKLSEEQYSNFTTLMGTIPDVMNDSSKEVKRQEIIAAKDNGLITSKQAEQLLNKVESRHNVDTEVKRSNISNTVGRNIQKKNKAEDTAEAVENIGKRKLTY
jgi:hypothetical protein